MLTVPVLPLYLSSVATSTQSHQCGTVVLTVPDWGATGIKDVFKTLFPTPKKVFLYFVSSMRL